MVQMINYSAKQEAIQCMIGHPVNVTNPEISLIINYTNFVLVNVEFISSLISNAMLFYGLWKTNRSLQTSQKLFMYLSIIDIITNANNMIRTWIQ
jgi:hypothetical protein